MNDAKFNSNLCCVEDYSLETTAERLDMTALLLNAY